MEMLTCSTLPSLLDAVAEAGLEYAVAALQAGIQFNQLLDIDVDYTSDDPACFGRCRPVVLL